MKSWILKILGLNGHEKIEVTKGQLFNEKRQAIADLKRINRQFKFVINADSIELALRDIDNIRKGK